MALLRRLGSCDWFIEGNVNKAFATEMTGMTCGFASKEGNTRQRPAPARRRGQTRDMELSHMEIPTLALIDVARLSPRNSEVP